MRKVDVQLNRNRRLVQFASGKRHASIARSDIRIARTRRPALPMTFQSLSCQQHDNGLRDLKGLKGEFINV